MKSQNDAHGPPHTQASAHPPSTATLQQRVRDLEHQLQQLKGGTRGLDGGSSAVASAGSPSAAAGACGLLIALPAH
eukprot:scaffold195601_cov15-Tisochrysis_lutea.AAC.1